MEWNLITNMTNFNTKIINYSQKSKWSAQRSDK